MPTGNYKSGKMVSRRKFLIAGAAILAMPVISRPAKATTYDVIVIGAGMAGLSAARKLNEAGKSVIILEARKRIGGRIHTDRSLGFPAELGANWIHGATGNPLVDLAKSAGARAVRFNHNDIAILSSSGRLIDNGERFPQLNDTYQQVSQAIAATCIERPVQTALDQQLTNSIREYGLSGADQDIMKVILDREFTSEYAAGPKLLNQCAAEYGEEFNGDDMIIINGYDRLPKFLAKGLEIKLDEAVESIRWTESGVAVQSSNNRYEAGYCICTVPLGVLKANAIRFENDLPDGHLEAISRIGFGSFMKAIVTFEGDAVLPKTNVAFVANDRRLLRNLVGLTGIAGRPAVMAYCGGEDAITAAALSDRNIAQEIAESVALARKSASPRIDNILVSRWSEDPFALGAYSYPGISTKPEDFEALFKPVDGRIYFAGEAASPYFGTVHGAHLSGIKAAETIIAA